MLKHRLAVATTVIALAAVSYLPLRATSAEPQTLPVAGIGAGSQAFATLSGIVTDDTGGVLPGTTLVLVNVESEAAHRVVANRSGRFEFVGLPPGDYLQESMLPGFRPELCRLTMAGQDVRQDVTLKVGSVEEAITVSQGAPGPTSYDRPRLPNAEPSGCSHAWELGVVEAGAEGATLPRVGGNISAPQKVRDVHPQYPPGADVAGTVVLEGVIGTDGFLGELRVVGAAHPDLASAATAAVRQWTYSSTRLNGVPIPVFVTVRVDFRNQQ